MRNFKLFSFCVVCITISSCIKEQQTDYIATLVNKSNHSVKILFYKQGIVQPTDTIKLNFNDRKIIADGFMRGLNTGSGFISSYFGSADDSIVVVFDNIYKITHYANLPVNRNPKYYLFTSLRNLGSSNSYIFTSVKVSKNRLYNTHTYEFTEQDYLEAK